jgi:hypothetical protein
MKRFFLFSLLFMLMMLISQVFGQDSNDKVLQDIFAKRGEVCFKFKITDRIEIHELTNIISIANVKGDEVTAFANKSQFGDFLKKGYSYSILIPSSMQNGHVIKTGADTADNLSLSTWNFYPHYQQYCDTMKYFATSHPAICKLDTIGTTVQGRLLLVLKISDSVLYDRGKPKFLYTSSIHGNETTGYVLMLHFIDYLLTNWDNNNQRVRDMIENTQIYINPLANPDGTYHGGDDTISNWVSTRSNANSIDLNRNYPDPVTGQHPDGHAWQPETIAFMNYADSNHFVLSMNFHGGSEVFNYPWDCMSKLHPDNAWWYFLGREYADTAHKYSIPGYFTFENNGVTNGYAWYEVHGGRQDYMTYFQNGREVTLEISNDFVLPTNQLINYWNYNYHSFLNYVEQASYGINGQVTDTLTGQPLSVKVTVSNHDMDNSFVYSYLPSGWYFRLIDQGTYSLTFTATGYFPKTFTNVHVTRKNTTRLNVKMVPLTIGGIDAETIGRFAVYPNPSTGLFSLFILGNANSTIELKVVNMIGLTVRKESNLKAGHEFTVDLTGYPKGVYFILVNDGYQSYNKKVILH